MSETTARILVVEDTPTQAELARVLLTSLGHQVRLAVAAGPALIAAREWQPDAILLDMELPDYNGFELMKQLSAEGIDAAVIVVDRQRLAPSAAVEAMRLGAVGLHRQAVQQAARLRSPLARR